MTKIMDRIKFLLKIILYTVIIFFTSIFITTLYIVSNQGVDSFQRGLSAFFLTMLCAFLLLLLCNQFKKGLIFSLEKFKFLEDFIKNNTLKRILKILLRLVLYSLIIFLNTLIVIILIDFSDEKFKNFPLETAQFFSIIAFISILFMLFKDVKKIYDFSSTKIKFLENLSQKTIEKTREIKDKILKIKFNFFIKIIEKLKKICDSISNKIEKIIDILEDKISYPERNEFKDRCNFSNIKNSLERSISVAYQILTYLTIFAIFCILISLIFVITYLFLIYFIALVTTIWEVIIAIIRQL